MFDMEDIFKKVVNSVTLDIFEEKTFDKRILY